MADSIDQEEKWRTLRDTGLVALAFFTSTGTLVCCALPIALVSIAGLGALVASMTSSFPILITLSQHKGWVFGLSGVMLAAAGWLVWRSRRTCPTDPALARWCARFQSWNQRMIIVSAVLWSTGFFAAFLALPLRNALGV
ncbi:MAG: hypothetical protein O7H40_05505 [Gammaproteobacteria bacterium]|nr:hypothetical protein [Gammaproteobacteria bacterium]